MHGMQGQRASGRQSGRKRRRPSQNPKGAVVVGAPSTVPSLPVGPLPFDVSPATEAAWQKYGAIRVAAGLASAAVVTFVTLIVSQVLGEAALPATSVAGFDATVNDYTVCAGVRCVGLAAGLFGVYAWLMLVLARPGSVLTLQVLWAPSANRKDATVSCMPRCARVPAPCFTGRMITRLITRHGPPRPPPLAALCRRTPSGPGRS